MNEPQPTPERTADSAIFDHKQREYARRVEDIRVANKAVLFNSPAAAGIEIVTVKFDGYGDSGQNERIDIEPAYAAIRLPSDRIEIAQVASESSEIERHSQTVQQAIETLAYDLIRQTHAGWEMADGSYGNFIVNVAERTIKLDYNELYTSFENVTHEF